MRKILLLDYDHTLYPATLNTLKAVDARITLYIQTFLGLTPEAADQMRLRLCEEYGTTLRGLEEHHGVERENYCDFIHAIEDEFLPPPDPVLEKWLSRISHPYYMFTNARMDWPVRGMKAMGLGHLLPDDGNGEVTVTRRLRGIFDIAFMDWEGKPNPSAYAKVDAFLRERHGKDIQVIFADDRQDNLETARLHGWSTVWISPLAAAPNGSSGGLGFDRALTSIVQLNPESLD